MVLVAARPTPPVQARPRAHRPARGRRGRAPPAAGPRPRRAGAARRRRRRAPPGRVGLTLNVSPVTPSDPSSEADRDVARRVDGLQNRVFLDPLLRGGYPGTCGTTWRRSAWPTWCSDGDLESIATPIDVLGVNYYYTINVRSGRRAAAAIALGRRRAHGGGAGRPAHAPRWAGRSTPEGLRDLLRPAAAATIPARRWSSPRTAPRSTTSWPRTAAVHDENRPQLPRGPPARGARGDRRGRRRARLPGLVADGQLRVGVRLRQAVRASCGSTTTPSSAPSRTVPAGMPRSRGTTASERTTGASRGAGRRGPTGWPGGPLLGGRAVAGRPSRAGRSPGGRRARPGRGGRRDRLLRRRRPFREDGRRRDRHAGGPARTAPRVPGRLRVPGRGPAGPADPPRPGRPDGSTGSTGSQDRLRIGGRPRGARPGGAGQPDLRRGPPGRRAGREGLGRRPARRGRRRRAPRRHRRPGGRGRVASPRARPAGSACSSTTCCRAPRSGGSPSR